jgi:hypothetical protein
MNVNEPPANDSPIIDASSSDAPTNNSPIGNTCEAPAPAVPAQSVATGEAEHAAKLGAIGALLVPVAALAAWIVPGAGHFLLGRWGRALGFFIAVAGLAVTGAALRGNIFTPHSGDLFGSLGFLADAASGACYFVGRWLETAGSDVSHAAGDYGTRFIATAGVVNLLAIFDVLEIASRRRA